MIRNIRLITLFLFLAMPFASFAQNQVTVSGNITQDTYWDSGTEYILDGIVFVTNNAKLTIEAGTVIKAQDGDDLDASALVVTTEGQIFAEGTPENPIIFTSIQDEDLTMGKNNTGLWGGVVILGEAPTNNPTEKAVEGVNEIADPISLAQYGGDNEMDNSGVFRYVSIRHTGMNIGSGSGNEIQGLTLGAVGAGTTIEFVESFDSADDGFEFFGGTVNTRYLVSAFVEDDGFDTDEGFRGKNQFWFVIQDDDAAGHMAEQDGSSTDNEDSKPFAYPQIANATYIGTGNYASAGDAPGGDPEESILLRDNTGVAYYNSVFADDFKSPFLVVEDVDGTSEFDSRARLEADSINFMNSVFATSLLNGGGSALADLGGDATYTNDMLSAEANANAFAEVNMRGISRNPDGGLDPRPVDGSSLLSGATSLELEDSWYKQVSYQGAFGGDLWIKGWTALDNLGFVGGEETKPTETVSGEITEDTYWTSDKEYILDGIVFVTGGAKLYIEAGTVIKAQDEDDLDASALVITTEGQIFAEGAPGNPIIFTSIQDTDLTMGKNNTGLWGGVVILGEAPTNNPTEKAVEGVNEIADPISLAQYGGDNEMDNSGVFRYVSIRHTGMNIGSGSGNEIQGLTLGAVGAGTTIEFVESFDSADDGFEFFGGTVNTRYLVSAFVEDDGFDTDEGFRGKNQFWFVIQDDDAAGHMAEQDGSSTDNEDSKPFAYPQIANATYIGTGNYASAGDAPGGDPEESILLRDNTGVAYYNSVFADDFKSPFLVVEDVDGNNEFDSRARLEADSINFMNSVFATSLLNGGLSALNTLGGDATYTNDMLADAENSNVVLDPMFKGISRNADGGLDPRPDNEAVLTGAMTIEGDADFFVDTEYRGAFGESNWLVGWTALAHLGYTTESSYTPIVEEELGRQQKPGKIALKQNYPNPFNPSTNIEFTLPAANNVKITVYDMTGRQVAEVANSQFNAGSHTVTFNASRLSSGVYFYRLDAGDVTQVRKMTLIK